MKIIFLSLCIFFWLSGALHAQAASFTFAAAGDHGSGSVTAASLNSLAASGAEFYLALGDLSYCSVGTETAWCDLVKSRVGAAFPFQLVAGNHEDDSKTDGFIGNFAACLPDRLNSQGIYAAKYYFDYRGLVRVIMIAPDLQINGTFYGYRQGDSHYTWLSNAIDGARAAGIPWVVVGMHKNCITIGTKSCEIGSDLTNLLFTKRVDLILQGHDHIYLRSKQLTCAQAGSFKSSCVADDGSDNHYTKGAGSVLVIAGAFGESIYTINPSTDPEVGYFAKWMGNNLNPTYGFIKLTVFSDQISADYVRSSGGTFSDHFTISSPPPPPDTTPPASPRGLRLN